MDNFEWIGGGYCDIQFHNMESILQPGFGFGFIKGDNIEIDPTKVIVDVNGIGYEIKISLRTYSKIKDLNKISIYTHLIVKEDSHILYGFYIINYFNLYCNSIINTFIISKKYIYYF